MGRWVEHLLVHVIHREKMEMVPEEVHKILVAGQAVVEEDC